MPISGFGDDFFDGVLGTSQNILGGFLAGQLFGNNQIYGWIGAFVVALIGAVIVRVLLGLVTPKN